MTSAISDGTYPWLISRNVWSCMYRMPSRCCARKVRTSDRPNTGQLCPLTRISVSS